MAQVTREQRRADAYIAKLNHAKEVARDRIVRELYEETRPRHQEIRRSPAFIDSPATYDSCIQPLTVDDWQMMLELMECRGVVNPRLVHSFSKRLEMIEEAVEFLIGQDVVLYDPERSSFWLPYSVFQAEACRDDADRQQRDLRRRERQNQKWSSDLVAMAS